MPGWCAHRGVEEVEFANRIIRPACVIISSFIYLPLR
ncbi:hypothetical protein [Gemmiger formicilis]